MFPVLLEFDCITASVTSRDDICFYSVVDLSSLATSSSYLIADFPHPYLLLGSNNLLASIGLVVITRSFMNYKYISLKGWLAIAKLKPLSLFISLNIIALESI